MEKIERTISESRQKSELTTADLLQAAFDSTDQVRFIVSEDGGVISFNRKAYENSILIHNKALKKGDNLYDFAADTKDNASGKLRDDLRRTFSGESFVTEVEIKYHSGSRWFQTEYVPVFRDKVIVAASISNYDITERKQAEIAVQQYINEMQSAIDTRLRHIELILDSLVANSEVLLEESNSLDEQISSKIRRLLSEFSRLHSKVKYWSQPKK
jgi:hypothetical protein